MMNRQSIDGDAEAEPLGAGRRRAENDVRRGQLRESGLAVDLGDPEAAEAELVGELGLLEKFIDALRRGCARRALDLGKQADFHARTVKSSTRVRGPRAFRPDR